MVPLLSLMLMPESDVELPVKGGKLESQLLQLLLYDCAETGDSVRHGVNKGDVGQ